MSGGQYSVESVEDRVDLVVEMANEERKFFEQEFTGTPPGYTDPDGETFAAWYEAKVAASPPALMTFPDGTQVVDSPWVVALSKTEGGMEYVNRYLRIRGARNGR